LFAEGFCAAQDILSLSIRKLHSLANFHVKGFPLLISTYYAQRARKRLPQQQQKKVLIKKSERKALRKEVRSSAGFGIKLNLRSG
jgi:hypothetical protein